jgi:branched-chain amino acid transport system substrate-binding protein
MAPWSYGYLQVLADAVNATKSLDDGKLADYIRQNTFKTVVGDVKFGPNGEWAEPRVISIQFHDIKGNDAEQFREMNTQTVLWPEGYTSGKLIYPYDAARK